MLPFHLESGRTLRGAAKGRSLGGNVGVEVGARVSGEWPVVAEGRDGVRRVSCIAHHPERALQLLTRRMEKYFKAKIAEMLKSS